MPGQARPATESGHKSQGTRILESPSSRHTIMCTQIGQLTADCLIKSAKRQREQKTYTGKGQIIGKMDSDFDSNFDLVSIAISIAVH